MRDPTVPDHLQKGKRRGRCDERDTRREKKEEERKAFSLQIERQELPSPSERIATPRRCPVHIGREKRKGGCRARPYQQKKGRRKSRPSGRPISQERRKLWRRGDANERNSESGSASSGGEKGKREISSSELTAGEKRLGEDSLRRWRMDTRRSFARRRRRGACRAPCRYIKRKRKAGPRRR